MTTQDGHTHLASSINPATGEQIERFPYLDNTETNIVLDRALKSFHAWRETNIVERAKCFTRLASVLRSNKERYARDLSLEMGKPIRQARAEVEKCSVLCEWYVKHGPAMIADEPTTVEGEKAYVSFLPLGLIFAITPWNFPFWQVMRSAVPILLAGNGFVLKPAPNVIRAAFNVAEAFNEAGFVVDILSVLNIQHGAVPGVIGDHRIAAVTLTGSVRAGAVVAAEAGRNLKKSVLELGGSDPFIVLADADLHKAVPAAVEGRFQNTGQICVAAKRIIVEAPIAEEFTRRFVDAVKALKVGDPLDEATYIGPMARQDLRDELDSQVKRTIEAGAKLLFGGKPIGAKNGAFYAPTVLGGVRPGMAAFIEETFGPVAAIIIARDAEEAVQLANDSEFGLSGALWTADIGRAKALARRMETGGVFINGSTASDPRTPIGGVKKSGYGRELSHFGIREFSNAQIVWQDRR